MKKIISILLVAVMLFAMATPVLAEGNSDTESIFLEMGDAYAKTAEEFKDYAADVQLMGYDRFDRSSNKGYPFEDGWMVIRGWFLTEGGPAGFAYTVNTDQADVTDPSKQMIPITTDYYFAANANLKSAGVYANLSNASYNRSGFSLGIYVGDLENGSVNSIKVYGINSEGRYAFIRDIKVTVPEFGWRYTEHEKIESEYVYEVSPEMHGAGKLSNPEFGFMSKKVWYTHSQKKNDPLTGLEYLGIWQKKVSTPSLDNFDTIEVKYAHNEGSGAKLSQKGANIVLRDYDGNVAWETGNLPDVDKSVSNFSPAFGWAALTQTATMKKVGSISTTAFWAIETELENLVIVLVNLRMYTNKAEFEQKIQELDTQIEVAETDARAIRAMLTAAPIELTGFNNEMLKADLTQKLSAHLQNGITLDALTKNSDGSYDVTLKHLDSKCVIKNVAVNVSNAAITVGGHDITDGVMAISNAEIELSKDDKVQENLLANLKELLGNDAVTVTVKNYSQKAKAATFDVEFSVGSDVYTLKDMSVTLKPVFTPPAEDSSKDESEETEPAGTEPESTETQAVTEAPTPTEDEKGGCGSSVTPVAFVAIIALTVLVFLKRRKLAE